MSAEKFHAGDRVLVVEGTHTGAAGPVIRAFKAYRSGRLEKLLTVDDGGTPIEVRQAFARMDSYQLGATAAQPAAEPATPKGQDLTATMLAALEVARDTIRTWNGMGMRKEVEEASWSAYQQSPEMKQINAAIDAATKGA